MIVQVLNRGLNTGQSRLIAGIVVSDAQPLRLYLDFYLTSPARALEYFQIYGDRLRYHDGAFGVLDLDRLHKVAVVGIRKITLGQARIFEILGGVHQDIRFGNLSRLSPLEELDHLLDGEILRLAAEDAPPSALYRRREVIADQILRPVSDSIVRNRHETGVVDEDNPAIRRRFRGGALYLLEGEHEKAIEVCDIGIAINQESRFAGGYEGKKKAIMSKFARKETA